MKAGGGSINVSANSPKITRAYISEAQLLPVFAGSTVCFRERDNEGRLTLAKQKV